MSELREMFLDELTDVFDAENQLLKALPKMVDAASDEGLQDGFRDHLKETEAQIDRLKQVFEMLGKAARGQTCKAMQGLIAEAEELIKEDAGDAALICAAQKMEHYEIASYGTLCSWARLLDEEKAVDQKLTELAEDTINIEAAEGEAEEEEEA